MVFTDAMTEKFVLGTENVATTTVRRKVNTTRQRPLRNRCTQKTESDGRVGTALAVERAVRDNGNVPANTLRVKNPRSMC